MENVRLYKKGLEVIKEFPSVYLSIYELELLLKADIYGIMKRFIERMYEADLLEEYSIGWGAQIFKGKEVRVCGYRDTYSRTGASLPDYLRRVHRYNQSVGYHHARGRPTSGCLQYLHARVSIGRDKFTGCDMHHSMMPLKDDRQHIKIRGPYKENRF